MLVPKAVLPHSSGGRTPEFSQVPGSQPLAVPIVPSPDHHGDGYKQKGSGHLKRQLTRALCLSYLLLSSCWLEGGRYAWHSSRHFRNEITYE